jgi:hypothetical protein
VGELNEACRYEASSKLKLRTYKEAFSIKKNHVEKH